VTAALACALAVVGCQGKKAKPADQAAATDAGVTGPRLRSLPPSPTVFPPEPPAEMPRELRFQLLEPGKGKRARLRYRGGGAARELPARAVVTTHAYADGTWSDELTLAPVRDGFGISVDPAGAPGAYLVHLRPLAATVDGAGATPAALAAAEGFVTRWRSLLEKRRADVTIDARGRLTAAVFLDDPAAGQSDARDELVQRWLGLAVPLPEEPVAPGARWRVVTLLRTGGAVVRQNALYTLVSAGDAEWTVEVSAERIGQPQDISIPGVAGSPGELVALRRVVTGTFTLAPADPLPLRGTLTAEVSTHARFRLPGGRSSERYTDDRATITLGP
jgi:hypothetical protein